MREQQCSSHNFNKQIRTDRGRERGVGDEERGKRGREKVEEGKLKRGRERGRGEWEEGKIRRRDGEHGKVERSG